MSNNTYIEEMVRDVIKDFEKKFGEVESDYDGYSGDPFATPEYVWSMNDYDGDQEELVNWIKQSLIKAYELGQRDTAERFIEKEVTRKHFDKSPQDEWGFDYKQYVDLKVDMQNIVIKHHNKIANQILDTKKED